MHWLDTAVFYQIYPQSFRDSNADGIGDIPGITEKLDYIKELGCNAIWVNPCFESPFGDAGYDVSDFYSEIRNERRSQTPLRRGAQERNKGAFRPCCRTYVIGAPVVQRINEGA